MELIVRVIVFGLGLLLVVRTLHSVLATLVLPRSAQDGITQAVFNSLLGLFRLRARNTKSYIARDRIMAGFAPLLVVVLLIVWESLLLLGYMALLWAVGIEDLYEAFRMSGSSLLTLGFENTTDLPTTLLAFSEAIFGLALITLLIAYLPTMYAAFSRREAAVTLLEVRAGNPPSAVEMLQRYQRIHGLERLGEQWKVWEAWFVELAESHTSLSTLVFFRSPQPQHSWVTASGALLDAASLTISAVDIPRDPQADLCIRAGYQALRRIADLFEVQYDPDPRPTDPISLSEEDFYQALEQLDEQGVPLKPDRKQAWRDFSGWRVNYDAVLLALSVITMAPEAPWSSDLAQHLSMEDITK